MLHKCPKDANDIKAPLLISLGRIFITDGSNHDFSNGQYFFFFLTHAFRLPLIEDHFVFWLELQKPAFSSTINYFSSP